MIVTTPPGFLSHVEANVNRALSLIDKAERGQKVEMRPIEVKEEKPSETVNAKVSERPAGCEGPEPPAGGLPGLPRACARDLSQYVG